MYIMGYAHRFKQIGIYLSFSILQTKIQFENFLPFHYIQYFPIGIQNNFNSLQAKYQFIKSSYSILLLIPTYTFVLKLISYSKSLLSAVYGSFAQCKHFPNRTIQVLFTHHASFFKQCGFTLYLRSAILEFFLDIFPHYSRTYCILSSSLPRVPILTSLQ